MKTGRRDVIAAVLLGAFPPAVIFCFQIAAPWFQLVADDGLIFITPLLEDSFRQVMSGNIPWWSHHTLCGFPVLGRGAGSLYPLHLLVHILKSTAGVPIPTFVISLILHISLGAVSSYCYLRYIGCRLGCAAVGAIGYSMAGPVFGFASNWPRDYSIPFAYLPLAFIFLEEALKRRPSPVLICAGGFIGGNVLLLAHPQMNFKLLLVSAIYLLLRSRKKRLGRAVISCVIALGIALLIGSVQVAATLEQLAHSLRAPPGGIADYDRTSFSLRPVFFLGVIFPLVQFNWQDDLFEVFPSGGVFAGPLVGLGIIAGLVYWRRTRLPAGTFLVLLCLYFILSLGKYFPGEPHLASLPLLKNFRYPIRYSAEFCGIAALLSAVGLELLLRHRHTRTGQIVSTVFPAVLGLAMIVSFSLAPGVNGYGLPVYLGWYVLVVLLWFLLRRYHWRYFLWGAVLFTGMGMVINIPVAKIISPADAKVFWQDPLPIGRDSQERVLFLGTIRGTVGGEGNYSSNMPHYFGGRGVFGYDSLRMRAQRKWKDAIGVTGETEFWLFPTAAETFLDTHLMKTLRVGWVVVPRSLSLLAGACRLHPDLEEMDIGRWMAVFRHNGFKSPAFFVEELVYEAGLQSGAEMGRLDLSRYAWVEPGYRGDMEFAAAVANRVQGFREEHGTIVFNVEAEENGFVVVTTTWYPGWRAYIDGGESPLFRVNSSFIGIPVPAGDHSVVLRYDPQNLRLLLAAGMVAYLAVIIILVRSLVGMRGSFSGAFRR